MRWYSMTTHASSSEGQAFTGEFVDDVKEFDLTSIGRFVELEVQCPQSAGSNW
tara:strand:+ start:5219 stop:5377 length:159 start_codon:yes stop_codon:yes gene_type:complete